MSSYDGLQELVSDILAGGLAFSFIVFTIIGMVFIILKMYKYTLLVYYSIKNHRYNYIAFMSECEYHNVDDIVEGMPQLVAIHYDSYEYCGVDMNGIPVRGQLGIRFNPVITDDDGKEIIVKTNTIGRVKNRPEKTIMFKVLKFIFKFILRKNESK